MGEARTSLTKTRIGSAQKPTKMNQWIPFGGLVLTILAIFWRTSSLTTRLEMTIAALEKEVEALKAERKHLTTIPELQKRLDQAEEIIAELTSTLRGKGQEDGIVARLRAIEKKFSGGIPAVRR
jgi:Tfp pilus assembly protein PilN